MKTITEHQLYRHALNASNKVGYTLIHESIDEENKFGWVAPNNNIIYTGMYGHSDFLEKLYSSFKQEKNAMEEIHSEEISDHIESLDDNEHPAWHNIECAHDSEIGKLKDVYYRKAYEDGYMRFGFYKIKKKPFYEFESLPEIIKIKNNFFNDINVETGYGISVVYYGTYKKKILFDSLF
jgi:hypothetical protein